MIGGVTGVRTEAQSRPQFRAHALDGAMLYFHRATGTSVRVETPRTAQLRRTAPRVVMFGITNACNLRCEFCSRDVHRPSTWTVESAAEMLEGLAAAGTLEVAFGGGEPYAFRGLDALVARLRASTELALHVTTNGTLLDPAIDFDQVRLSIYEGWEVAAQKLLGRRWGANVLVDDACLDGLPSLLNALVRFGASDVSLLSYVGPDPARHLSRAGEQALAAIVRASPLPCRVSVCWGDRLESRLFGGDCGAGLDFVTLTSDRRLQSCSFQDSSVAIASAEDLLRAWRKRALGAPSSRAGCMRSARPRPTAGVRVYRGFSGNNSGECVLSARFEEIGDAETMLADLVPGFAPGDRYTAPWRELFEREGIMLPHDPGDDDTGGYAPDEIATIGKTFLARTDSAPGDDFPELRALAWKRGAYVTAGGVHVHEGHRALVVVRGDVAAVQARALRAASVRHGDRVVLALAFDTLAELKPAVLAIAGDQPFAIELFAGDVSERDLGARLAQMGQAAAEVPRLAARFWPDKAGGFADSVGVPARRGLVLVENVVRRKRLALLAIRQGGGANVLDGEEVIVRALFWRPHTPGPKPPPIDVARLERVLDAHGLHQAGVKEGGWGGRVSASVCTTSPAGILSAFDAAAREEGLELSLGVAEVDPLGQSIRRLLAAV